MCVYEGMKGRDSMYGLKFEKRKGREGVCMRRVNKYEKRKGSESMVYKYEQRKGKRGCVYEVVCVRLCEASVFMVV